MDAFAYVRACVVCVLVCALAVQSKAAADDLADSAPGSSERTPSAAAAGVFMRHVDSPTTQTHRAAFNTQAGYDGARTNAAVELRAELVLLGGSARSHPVGVSLLGGASYFSPATHADVIGQGRVNASGGVKLQPLFQAQHGVDAAISVRYVSQGFNLSPAVATTLALARSLAGTQLLLNLDYGQAFENGDRYGRVRTASLTHVVRGLHLGVAMNLGVGTAL